MSKSSNSTTFKLLFEHSPIPMWEMDFTKLFSYFEAKRQKGIVNLNTHLVDHPNELPIFSNHIKIENANLAVLQLFEVADKKELITFDAAVIATDHTSVDYLELCKCISLVIDTRNATASVPPKYRNVVVKA